MKLTKFLHACLVLENSKTRLVIDPGSFTHDFIVPKHVDAVVITHNHPDHCDPTLIEKIHKANPHAKLVAHESIVAQFPDIPHLAVNPNETHTVGNFTLSFFGGEHAPIAPLVTVPPNLGVLVNQLLYYPGDSFVIPQTDQPVQAVALPVSAPWLLIRDSFSFLTTVRPEFAFPTHDAILSADGQALIDRMIGQVANDEGIIYKRLNSQSIEL